MASGDGSNPKKGKKYRIKIIEELCKGCGFCVEFCPRHVFEESDELSEKGVRMPKIRDEEACAGCGLCAMLCPEIALFLEEEGEEKGAE